MSPSRRRALGALPAGLLFATFGHMAGAQQPRIRANYDYRVIEQPRPVANPDRLEVIEFFWYGCPYCNALQPSLEAWLKRKPADVEFRRIPAVFRRSWEPHVRIYYTLEALGQLERLHQDVYRSIHVEREALNSTDSTADWAVRRGIERAKWVTLFESAEIARKVEQAVLATRAYQIEGTPSLVVDGRYITSTSMSESIAGVITTLDELVALARTQRR